MFKPSLPPGELQDDEGAVGERRSDRLLEHLRPGHGPARHHRRHRHETGAAEQEVASGDGHVGLRPLAGEVEGRARQHQVHEPAHLLVHVGGRVRPASPASRRRSRSRSRSRRRGPRGDDVGDVQAVGQDVHDLLGRRGVVAREKPARDRTASRSLRGWSRARWRAWRARRGCPVFIHESPQSQPLASSGLKRTCPMPGERVRGAPRSRSCPRASAPTPPRTRRGCGPTSCACAPRRTRE